MTYLRATDPTTPAEALRHIATSDDKKIRQAVASNPNTDFGDLLALAKEFPEEVQANPAFGLGLTLEPNRVQEAYEEDATRIIALARVATGSLLAFLLNSNMIRAKLALLLRGDLDTPTLQRLVGENDALFAVALTNENVPVDFLERGVTSKDPTVRERVAEHPGATPEMLERLAQDAHPFVAAAVAKNPNASPALLWEVAKAQHPHVNKALLGRADCPPPLRAELEAA